MGTVEENPEHISLKDNADNCAYCNRSFYEHDLIKTIDHKLPKSRGGSEKLSNKVVACWQCNSVKAGMTSSEYSYFLERMKKRAPDLLSLLFDAHDHYGRRDTDRSKDIFTNRPFKYYGSENDDERKHSPLVFPNIPYIKRAEEFEEGGYPSRLARERWSRIAKEKCIAYELLKICGHLEGYLSRKLLADDCLLCFIARNLLYEADVDSCSQVISERNSVVENELPADQTKTNEESSSEEHDSNAP